MTTVREQMSRFDSLTVKAEADERNMVFTVSPTPPPGIPAAHLMLFWPGGQISSYLSREEARQLADALIAVADEVVVA